MKITKVLACLALPFARERGRQSRWIHDHRDERIAFLKLLLLGLCRCHDDVPTRCRRGLWHAAKVRLLQAIAAGSLVAKFMLYWLVWHSRNRHGLILSGMLWQTTFEHVLACVLCARLHLRCLLKACMSLLRSRHSVSQPARERQGGVSRRLGWGCAQPLQGCTASTALGPLCSDVFFLRRSENGGLPTDANKSWDLPRFLCEQRISWRRL